LRSDIIWHKPNPMPESVTDRPTKAHEYVFLLTKSARYFYDADAVREAHKEPLRSGTKENRWNTNITDDDKLVNRGFGGGKYTERIYNPSGRNRRTVWTIPTKSYSGAHFATFPPALVEPCIKAGTSERGCCPVCGNQWVRVTKKETRFEGGSGKAGTSPDDISGKWGENRYGKNILLCPVVDVTTTGWEPSCDCWYDGPHDPIPATVFDPFSGSGTTVMVANQQGRRGVGLDLSLDYIELAKERTGLAALDAWENGIDASEPVDLGPMFADI
jgi:hypothetical protein